MTQRGDGPTTRRMGFGYEQARAAGAPFRNERAASTVNAERLLRDVQSLTLNYNRYGISAHHPDPKGHALRYAKCGVKATQIVEWLREEAEAAKKAKAEAADMEWWQRLRELEEQERN
jgi:hypothetical protein